MSNSVGAKSVFSKIPSETETLLLGFEEAMTSSFDRERRCTAVGGRANTVNNEKLEGGLDGEAYFNMFSVDEEDLQSR